MQAIILVDRNGGELLPLTDNTSIGLLPVAGKTVLEHTFEALVEAGIKSAHVVLCPFAAETKEMFGNGARWGISLTYSTSRGEELPQQHLNALSTVTESFLMLRGDVVRPYRMIKSFLEKAENRPERVLCAAAADQPGFIVLCNITNPRPEELATLAWPAQRSVLGKDVYKIDLEDTVNKLDTLMSYHKANLDAVGNRMVLRLPGKETALGLTQGRNSRVYPQNIRQGKALVGANCLMYPSTRFSGEVVVGDHVIIDRCVILEDTVVLPDTYIGELVELRNAIVRGNDLIRVDTGAILKIVDAFLLAHLEKDPINNKLSNLYNRFMGSILLVLSLPLWFLAAMAAVLKNPGQLIDMEALRGNKIVLNEYGMPQRAEFIAFEFNVSPPILRYLPRLLAVVKGDLRLVGALPVSTESASKREHEWEKLADQAPAGIIGSTQLLVSADASEEEKLMSDAYFWTHYSFRQEFRILALALRMLFSRKAWSA